MGGVNNVEWPLPRRNGLHRSTPPLFQRRVCGAVHRFRQSFWHVRCLLRWRGVDKLSVDDVLWREVEFDVIRVTVGADVAHDD